MSPQQLADLLAALPPGRTLWVTGLGRSLYPLLRSGDSVRVLRCSPEDVAVGDLCVLRTARGGLVGHLVDSVAPVRTTSFLGKEDQPGTVLGRAVALRRSGLVVPLPRLARPVLRTLHRLAARAYRSRRARAAVDGLRALVASRLTAPARRALLGPVHIRRLEAVDRDALLIFGGDRLRFTAAFLDRELSGHWRGPGAAFGAFDRRRRLLGFMYMGEYRQEGVPLEGIWMRGLVVARRARGLGVGGRLLDAACDHARREGHRVVFTDVREDNAPSLAMVRARGFVEAPAALQDAVQRLLSRRGEGGRVIALQRTLA